MTQLNSPRTTSAAVDAMGADWPMIDALMGGTPAMRLAGCKFLPQWPSEEDDSYKTRLATAVLHPVFQRTVLINAAKPFAKPIAFGETTPEPILKWAEDIDLQGTQLGAFAGHLMVCCLSKGLTGVLVDFPTTDGVRTKAQEKSAGVRPYCVHYDANCILGWRTAKGSSGLRLTQLRLLESVEINDGDFAVKSIEQVRVLEPGTWKTWRKADDGEWAEHESGKTTLDFIPFVFFYGKRLGFGIGQSPLRDLAFQNVEHWQSASDQQTILHVARVPILFGRMLEEAKIAIGAGSMVTASNEKAELKYVEHTGAAIEAGQTSLTELENRMRRTGAELISLDPGYATATEVASEDDGSRSLLQQIVEVFGESIDQMLNFMSAWVKQEGEAEVELYTDYGASTDTDAATLGTASSTGVLSKQSHFEELQRRDIVSSDRTWEEEKKRMAAEPKDDPNPKKDAA